MKSSTPPASASSPPSGVKPRPRIIIWLVRIGIALLVLPFVLALTGATYQAVASALDRRNYPPPGQLVDVGGYKLHLLCMGEGAPTVILDAANQGTVSNWIWIQPELARSTRVCAYDRAGLGWSDLGPGPQDTQANAQALGDSKQVRLLRGENERIVGLVGVEGAQTARRFEAESRLRSKVGFGWAIFVNLGKLRREKKGGSWECRRIEFTG
jgi:hypothetical protein